MNKLFTYLIIGIFLISIVSAQNFCGNENSFLGTFKQNEQISLRQVCDDCSFVNLTAVTFPNSTTFNYNEEMTKNGVNYNYDFSTTNLLGCYSYDVLGNKGGINTAETIDFKVTPSGTSFTNALSIPIFLPMILMLLVSGLFFMMISIVKKKEYKWAFLLGTGFFTILSVFFGIAAGREILVGFPTLYSFVNALYWILIVLVPASAFMISIMVAFHVIKRVFDSRGYNPAGV